MFWKAYLIFVIFLHEQNFLRIKFTPKKRVNYDEIHSKLPIFRVKSVKIYTGQKNLHEHARGARDKYQICWDPDQLADLSKPVWSCLLSRRLLKISFGVEVRRNKIGRYVRRDRGRSVGWCNRDWTIALAIVTHKIWKHKRELPIIKKRMSPKPKIACNLWKVTSHISMRMKKLNYSLFLDILFSF